MSDLTHSQGAPANQADPLAATGLTLFWGAIGVHAVLTTLATIGYLGHAAPFTTAVAICVLMLVRDRTVFVAYAGLLLMVLIFLAPLILYGTPIAIKTFRGHDLYDRGLILSLYWFIGFFACYVPTANRLGGHTPADLNLSRSDVVPLLSCLVLLVFSALMLQGGTLLSGGYREITAERHGFIEFAALLTLIGFCAARSSLVRNLLIACVVIYLVTTFMVGLRLRFLSMITVAFCCLVGLRVDPRWKMIGLALALALLALGFVRNAGLAEASLSSGAVFEQLYNRGAVVSTPGGAFQTSKFHAFTVDTIAPIHGGSGLYFLVGDFLSIFLTKDGIPANMEIKRATETYFEIPGGGMLPGYFYAYFGIVGAIVLSALFTGLFIAILQFRMAGAFPYQVLLAAYAPRTLLYDWTVAFKMMFFFFILSSILTLAARAAPEAPAPWRSPQTDP